MVHRRVVVESSSLHHASQRQGRSVLTCVFLCGCLRTEGGFTDCMSCFSCVA